MTFEEAYEMAMDLSAFTRDRLIRDRCPDCGDLVQWQVAAAADLAEAMEAMRWAHEGTCQMALIRRLSAIFYVPD